MRRAHFTTLHRRVHCLLDVNHIYSQLDNFKKLIKAYNGRDSNAVKYFEKVEAFIDKPLDELELKDIREIMNKVKFPRKLDISVFY